jgi:hypothetical protein
MALASRGRPQGAKTKPWEEALRVVALRENDKGEADEAGKLKKNLMLMAEKTVNMALDGDLGAIQEVANRLDGKAKETKDVTVEHRSVARIPMPAETAEDWAKDHAPNQVH